MLGCIHIYFFTWFCLTAFWPANVTIVDLTHDLFPARLGNDHLLLKIDAASIHKGIFYHREKGHNPK
jgi:hypothetical protein